MPVKRIVSRNTQTSRVRDFQANRVRKVLSSVGIEVSERSYIHVQQTPSSLWIVNHNLGTMSVIVTIYDNGWEEFDAGVVVVDENTVHVVCNPPLSGYAVVRG